MLISFCSFPSVFPRLAADESQASSGPVCWYVNGLTVILLIQFIIKDVLGFGTMLHKAPGLRHQLHSPSSPAVTNGNPQLLRSNPLLTVSRNWCLVTRTALLRYWREGGAVAWDFLQHLFGSSRLVLIAPHFPALLALLQERDMHCESILRDPIVARELLRLANADPPAECHETVSEAEVVVKGRRYLISSNPTAIGVTSDWLHMEPTKRSILIAAARAFLSLRGHVAVERTLLDGSFDALRGLYHNIECPLLRCAGEMHATGISVDSPQLSAMTREVAERRDVVLWLLQRASGSASFNPDSSSDCRRLVAVIEAQGRRLFARRYRATPHDTQIGKTHQSPFVQSRPYAAQRSDWSAGRSPIHSIAVPTTAGVENLAEEDFISEYLASHPVRCLLSEWHTHSLALPLLRGILRYRAGGRVCAYFNVVGSETGRLVAVQPPIQSLSKAINIFSLPSKRTVWDEVRDALHKAFAPALAALNRSLVRSAENCYLVASLLSEDGVMQANVGAINWLSELGAGVRPVVRLLHVLSIPSSRPYSQIDSMHGPFSLSAVELAPLSAEPLTSLFRGADPTALQAIVSIGEEISAVAEPKYYLAVVPLDQLQRITQPLQPSIEESSIIERSLSNDYDPFSEHDRMLVQQLSMKRRTLLPRRALRAAPGYVLISADYSQIELRLLAHFSGDSGLLTAFGAIPPLSSALNPPISGDVFRALARQWFALPGDDEVSDELRAIVKQVSNYIFRPILPAYSYQLVAGLLRCSLRCWASSRGGRSWIATGPRCGDLPRFPAPIQRGGIFHRRSRR